MVRLFSRNSAWLRAAWKLIDELCLIAYAPEGNVSCRFALPTAPSGLSAGYTLSVATMLVSATLPWRQSRPGFCDSLYTRHCRPAFVSDENMSGRFLML